MFGHRQAQRELRRYRKKGPDRVTSRLLAALQETPLDGSTLLDVGGGIGVLQHELLAAGIAKVTGADAAPAYLEAAREESARRGTLDRVEHHFGDFVDLASSLEPADIVTLNRVICCYPEMERLVGLSASRARRLYALVFPRDDPWIKALRWVPNTFFRVSGNPFRVFVHATRAVERVVQAQGWRRRFYERTAFWQIVVYERC